MEASPETAALLMPVPGLSPQEQVRRAWPALVTPECIERERDFLEDLLRIGLENPVPAHVLGRQMVALLRFDSYDRLPRVQAPSLIVHGDRDQMMPVENARILHKRISNSTLHILPHTGHFFWEKPKESARAIVEFLSTVPAPA